VQHAAAPALSQQCNNLPPVHSSTSSKEDEDSTSWQRVLHRAIPTRRRALIRDRAHARSKARASGVREPCSPDKSSPKRRSALLARRRLADRDCQGEREEQGPRASRGYANARVNQKHTEIDGIAGPTVDAGCHARSGGRGRCAAGRLREVQRCEAQGANPTCRVAAKNQTLSGDAGAERDGVSSNVPSSVEGAAPGPLPAHFSAT
jgi:hypothetical protein